MRYLGIDLGTKRIGLSISDLTGIIASPLQTILRDENTIQNLKEIISEYKITDIVLGLPKNMNNSLGESAISALDFEKQLKELNINVHLQDERRTTIIANNFMLESNMSRKNRKTKIDEAAASIILQTYLDRKGR